MAFDPTKHFERNKRALNQEQADLNRRKAQNDAVAVKANTDAEPVNGCCPRCLREGHSKEAAKITRIPNGKFICPICERVF